MTTEKHEILQLEDRFQCTFCHKNSKRAYCDCGKILDGISTQGHEQVCLIIADSYKTMETPFGWVWVQSLDERGKRITENKESQDFNRAKKHVSRAFQFGFESRGYKNDAQYREEMKKEERTLKDAIYCDKFCDPKRTTLLLGNSVNITRSPGNFTNNYLFKVNQVSQSHSDSTQATRKDEKLRERMANGEAGGARV